MSSENHLADHRLVVDNDDFRITLWSFQPGERTGVHEHLYAYVVVPLSAGQFTIMANGARERFDMVVEKPYYRPPGARHDLVASNGAAFLEIEIKGPETW